MLFMPRSYKIHFLRFKVSFLLTSKCQALMLKSHEIMPNLGSYVEKTGHFNAFDRLNKLRSVCPRVSRFLHHPETTCNLV